MAFELAFVTSIAASPGIRLTLHHGPPAGPWNCRVGTTFEPPPLKRATPTSMLSDGGTPTAAVYENRIIRLQLQLLRVTDDQAAMHLQALYRELDRPSNILMYKPASATYAVFFKTFRAGPESVEFDPVNKEVVVTLMADPMGHGPKETLAPVVVNNNPAAASNGMFLDIPAPKGDVETPLYLTVSGGMGVAGRLQSALAIRRRGTPANLPLFMQAEAMTQGTDTATQPNDAAFSGSGNNYSKTTFSTNAGMLSRIYTPARFPATASTDARGTYRIFVRLRQNIASNFDEFDLRLVWGGPVAAAQVINDTVKLPYDNGLNGATFKYIYLGLIQIPMGRDPVTDGSGAELSTEGVYLYVQAQRVAGTGNLDFDHILAMPADDRFQMVKWPTNQFFTDDVFVLEGGATPSAYSLRADGQLTSNEAIEIVGGGMMISPGRTNRVVFARDVGIGTAEAGLGDVITATTTLTPSYFPRYLSVRPVGT